MNQESTLIDLERLLRRANSALGDSDESGIEILVCFANLLRQRGIAVKLARCEASGSALTSGEKCPIAVDDYCLNFEGKLYNLQGVVEKADISCALGEWVIEQYATAGVDPGETQLYWIMDATYEDTSYLEQSTISELTGLFNEEIAAMEHAQLQAVHDDTRFTRVRQTRL